MFRPSPIIRSLRLPAGSRGRAMIINPGICQTTRGLGAKAGGAGTAGILIRAGTPGRGTMLPIGVRALGRTLDGQRMVMLKLPRSPNLKWFRLS